MALRAFSSASFYNKMLETNNCNNYPYLEVFRNTNVFVVAFLTNPAQIKFKFLIFEFFVSFMEAVSGVSFNGKKYADLHLSDIEKSFSAGHALKVSLVKFSLGNLLSLSGGASEVSLGNNQLHQDSDDDLTK